MAKLLVKNKETGATRPMTKASFDLVGHKRGYIVVGPYEEPKTEEEGKKSSPSDIVKAEMERLKAEKAAKDAEVIESEEIHEPEVKESKKRGPKPKKSSDEV
jgi:hypothetical protein